MKSQELAACAGYTDSSQTGVPSPNPEALYLTYSQKGKKKSVFSNGVTHGIETTPKGRLQAQLTQNKRNCIFGDVLFKHFLF